jgi:hypothetical protein
MEEETGRAFLKWTLAIIVLAGISLYALQNVGDAFRAGVAFGDDASEAASDGSGEPVVNGEAPPQADFALIDNAVGFLASDGMAIGPGPADGLVLSFPLIAGDPNCVQTARIELPVREASPAQLALYPSAIPDLTVLTEGATVAEPITIPLAAPPIANTEATPGLLAWDVGQLYRTWTTGGSFDGTPGPTDPAAFTVVVRPNDEGEPGRRIAVASAESPDFRPRLIWEGAPGCPAGASPTPTATATPTV